MKLSEKGFSFLLPLITVGILLLLIGFSVFYIKNQLQTNLLSSPSPSIFPTSSDNQLIAEQKPITPFQQLLIDKCQTVEIKNPETGQSVSTWSGLLPQDLPVSLNSNLTLTLPKEGLINCLYGNPNQQFLSLRTADENIMIYDQNSVELGHGGPPFLGVFGEKIGTKGGVDVYLYAGFAEAGPSHPGQIPLVIRGIRELTLNDGSKIYLVADRDAIHTADPRLVNYFRQYLTKETDESTLYNDDVSKNLPSLVPSLDVQTEPEKTNIESLLTTLNSFSPK